jgi:hypothetical protein
MLPITSHQDAAVPAGTSVAVKDQQSCWSVGCYANLVGEPDARNSPVRFDERGVETEQGGILRHRQPKGPVTRTATPKPPRHSSTLPFRIGRVLGEHASKARQMIVATHSADVLRGVLNSGAKCKILRIDRIGNRNTFRALDTEQIKTLVTDPLLSSARVLDGLFYSGAVVVEADADARFYHTVSTN